MLGEVSSNCSVKPCVLSQQVGPCKLLVRNAQVRCAVPIFGSRCCYSRVIVSFSGTPTSFRLRSTVLVFGAAVLLVLGARVVLPCCEASRSIHIARYRHLRIVFSRLPVTTMFRMNPSVRPTYLLLRSYRECAAGRF